MTTKNLEIGLKHLIDKNEAACLNLVQKPTLRQAKISRLEANYYRFVTEDLPELTIADLRVIYDLKDVTLEELYEKLQTKLLVDENAEKAENAENAAEKKEATENAVQKEASTKQLFSQIFYRSARKGKAEPKKGEKEKAQGKGL